MLFEPYWRRHDCIAGAGGLSESRRSLICTDSPSGRKRPDLFSFFLWRRNPFHGLAAGKFIRSTSSVKSTDMLAVCHTQQRFEFNRTARRPIRFLRVDKMHLVARFNQFERI